MKPVSRTELLNAINTATQYNVMPPPNATLCRHSIGCRVSVQNLIRAEDVGGRFELGQCMVRRPTAREKFVDEGKSASMYPACLWRVCSPGHDEIRRVPVLQNPSAV